MRVSLSSALAVAFSRAVIADAGISPATVDKHADPGTSFHIEKVVSTPQILPKPDVVLLVDVTGSMGGTLDNIKENLGTVITTVKNEQPNAELAVVSFGDLKDPNGFTVNQGLTADKNLLQDAVDSLKAENGGDVEEDWINALFQVCTGAVDFRADSSRILALIGDAPSHPVSGGHTLGDAINALHDKAVRVIAVNVGDLDRDGQATSVTAATGGKTIGSAAKDVSDAIVSGLTNLAVTVQPDIISCDKGLGVSFNPGSIRVTSGETVKFDETVTIDDNAIWNKDLKCSVRFLLNGTPGGDSFVQQVNVTVNQMGCFTCDPRPGKNKCHPTTSCAPTPFGTMCLTRPGYKADGVDDDDVKTQWRMKWPVGGHEHRVAVNPGTSADTLCDKSNTGPAVCTEVILARCPGTTLDAPLVSDQTTLGQGEL